MCADGLPHQGHVRKNNPVRQRPEAIRKYYRKTRDKVGSNQGAALEMPAA